MTGNFDQQVDAALVAHGLWKARLREAIDSGKSDFSVDKVQRDDACDFGQWLRSPGHHGPEFDKVRQLHAAFHLEAAKVLQLAVTGRKADAVAALGIGGEFSKASSRLVVALKSWQQKAA